MFFLLPTSSKNQNVLHVFQASKKFLNLKKKKEAKKKKFILSTEGTNFLKEWISILQ